MSCISLLFKHLDWVATRVTSPKYHLLAICSCSDTYQDWKKNIYVWNWYAKML